MTEATPRPWYISGRLLFQDGGTENPLALVASFQRSDDAVLTLRTVNNYDKALELLREARPHVDRTLEQTDSIYSASLRARIDAFLEEKSNGRT